MMNSSNSEYAISHENELAYVLSKFNSDYVYNTVIESLNTKLRSYGYSVPNIVNAFEQNFIVAKADFPNNTNEIVDVRNDTYANIIKILCDYYQLIYDDNDNQDIFTAASIMYSFLVSDFQQLIINFFVNFINKEKNSLYEMYKLSDQKRSKDISTIYSKKIFKSQKMAIISANLESIINNICGGFDIDLDTYINFAYGENKEFCMFLSSSIKPINDFFKTYIASVFDTEFRSIIITSIRLELQQSNMDDIDIDIVNKEGE